MKHHREWRALNTRMREAYVKVSYAEVACRQMGCGSVVSLKHNTNDTDQHPAWEVHFTCQGTESTLRECGSTTTGRRVQGESSSTTSLEVICAGNKEKMFSYSNVFTSGISPNLSQTCFLVCQTGKVA